MSQRTPGARAKFFTGNHLLFVTLTGIENLRLRGGVEKADGPAESSQFRAISPRIVTFFIIANNESQLDNESTLDDEDASGLKGEEFFDNS